MQRTEIGTSGQRGQRVGLLAFVLALFVTLLFFVAATQALAQPPAVSGTAARQVHATTARLEGLVNPEGKATSYQFEYLPQVRWEEEGESFAAAATAPASPAAIGAGIVGIPVAEKLSGLDPTTTYRFRLLASSGEGTESEAGAFATYALPQVFEPGSCPNETFRSGPSAQLPDCRAYEQASPVDKNGGNVGAKVELSKAALDGDGVTFESQAGVPGGEGSQAFPIYMASREGGGWTTRGLLPPGTNEAGSVLGWTPDFALTFDAAVQKLGGGEALLARPRQGNPLSQLAPYTDPSPQYAMGGSSAEDSTVIFEATGALPVKAGSPAPAAGKRNVYAWNRESGERSLAGVLPNGSVPTEGSSVTGGYMQEMHATAEDGSAFFVDQDANQLYLRLHPTEAETSAKDGKGNCLPDPVLACTLAVSASQRSAPDPGGSFAPTFRGAAADGSSAFFTSKEELTDEADTIADPEVIGRASVSTGEEAATGVAGDFISGPDVSALAADSSHLYWVNAAAGTIGRIGLSGENEEAACITGANEPKGIAVGIGADANHLYWTNSGNGTIGRADISGSCAAAQGSANQALISGATSPLGIDTDGTFLYWANTGEQPTRAIGRAAIDGSGVNQEFADQGDIFKPQDVAVDPLHNTLYIARGYGAAIARAKLDDGEGKTFLPAGSAQQIATDGHHLYWTYATSEAGATENVARSDLDGTEEEATFVAAQSPAGVAVGAGADSGHLYWGAHPSGRGEDLYRFDAASGGLTDITLPEKSTHGGDVQGLLGVSDDGSYAYFVANGSFDGASEGGCRGSSGNCNLYLWHEGAEGNPTISFIARLDAGGGNVTGDYADWVREGSALVGLKGKTARVTLDGGTVLFRSTRRLSPYKNEGEAELYRYRVGDAGPTCVSCDPSGAPLSGPATLGSLEAPFLGAGIQMNLLSRNLSADGDRVFFESRDSLVAADTNGDEGCPGWGSGSQANTIKSCQDVYEWEAAGSGSCSADVQGGGCLYLLSSGKSDQASFFADADEEGDNAFIFTASQLVGQDEDHLMDVYDARVGGGLASQAHAAEASCEGEACQGPLPALPAAQAPGSAGFSGEGNQAPKRQHKKKKHRKHKHAKHKQHRQANKNRGAGR